jgi:nucleoside-diphosphate-sugar epimerase
LKKKILIIGGTGFIGHHLAKKCLKLSWHVVSLSSKKPENFRRLKKIKYLYGDISYFKNLSVLLNYNFHYVVNLGGYIDHHNKTQTYKSHFLGVKNLAKFFLKKNIESFIQAGSSAEYGNTNSPHKETFKCKPEMIYGKSKLKSTKYLINLHKKKNFPATVIRYYQVYGPGQSINRFIPLLINACIKNIEFPASHGKQKRDFLYIEDAVSAILKALINKTARGEVINIGSGRVITLLSLMKTIKKKIGGGKILLGRIKLRKDEPMIIAPNLSRSRKILKWQSTTSLKQGINKTIKFYKRII